MLSDVTYQRLAGTNVLSDFVELPSQLMEHWIQEPTVLKKFCKHVETKEAISDEILKKIKDAKNFNLGFETVEYLSSALLDQELHSLGADELKDLNVADFENKILAKIDMPKSIICRHRPSHFQHLFSSSSYASAYYVYLWAEVLDADAFDAFKEAGDCFDKEVALKARKFIYSSGNTKNPKELFRLFRGRDAIIEPMLKKKGLLV